MAGNINVNRSNTDPFYRYKMPRIVAKVEGKGNGIKTVISNMVEIAKSLERPPTYPTKYFGCELGAQTQVDTKNDRYIVNGEHDSNKLQDILDGFIKKFVLCPSCDNPETTLSVRKGQINSKCKACGHAFVIDPRHRLSTFILKNPPKIEVDLDRGKEKTKPANGVNGTSESPQQDDDSKHGSSSGDDAFDDDDWAPEVENNESLAAGVGKLVISADLDKPMEERLDMLHRFFEDKKKKDEIGDGLILVNEAERLELKNKAPLLLANVIFDEKIISEKQVEKYRKCLLRFTLGCEKAQRYLLGGIEQVIMKHKEVLLKRAPHIIKALFDEQICDEENILKWADKPTSKYVSKSDCKAIIKSAEKVINWLREAEEESDEDESEEEINFEAQKTSVLAKEQAERVKAQITKVEGTNGEVIDINDI